MDTINIGIESSTIEKMNAILRTYPEVEKAIVYGSRAKGNYKPYSDLDLTLVGARLTLTIQQKIENQLDDLLLPYKIDLSILHHIQNSDLVEHIERVGKPLYIASS